MKETIGKAVSLAFGLAMLGKEQMDKYVGELVKKGEMTREESKVWIEAAATKGKEMEAAIEKATKEQIKLILSKQGLATKEELELLTKRIEKLERQQQ